MEIKGKLLKAKISALTLHPRVVHHHEKMKFAADYLTPAVQSNSELCSEHLLTAHLMLNTPHVVKTEQKPWLVVAKTLPFYLARLHLPAETKLNVTVVEGISDEDIDMMMVHEYVLAPIYERSIRDPKKAWAYKSYFEDSGLLASVGVDSRSEKQWAEWLNRDYRTLKS